MSQKPNKKFMSKLSLIAGSIFILSAIAVTTTSASGEKTESSVKAGTCTEHGIANNECFICDSSLREKGRLWCKEHSRYEDRCFICHPDLKDNARLFCEEHGLYEDECFACHPDVKKQARPAITGKRDSDHSSKLKQCSEHGVPASKCFICDPSLREKGRLWCKEHNRYEDRCFICHPELKDSKRLFCEEHDLYEDECYFCHPELEETTGIPNKASSKDRPVLLCNEHRVPEHECGICQPELAADLKPGESMKVRFVSEQSISKAGLRTARPSVSLSAPRIEAFCEVNYNGNEMARITPLASGVIQRVLANIGARVEAGDVLVEVNSAEIAEAKAAYLSAIADVQVKEMASKREEKLVKEKISATREFQEAKASFDIATLAQSTAHQRLLNYGFTEEEIEQIEKAHDSSSSFSVRAPFSGTLILREAVVGEVVSPGDALFTLANLNSMWLELSIPANQANFVEQGLDVQASFNSRAGVVSEGNIFWVATSIDERSRMLKARAIIPNDGGKIKAGMFGQAVIKTGQATKTFCIPKDAIQRLEGNPYLFVKEGVDLLALRRVVLGNVNDSRVDILLGISETDQIVVQGSFIAMSEFLKSRLGAGCTDD